MFQRVLVPLDGSALSERAVPHAAELAERLSVPVTLLFVVDGWDKVAQTLARTNGELDREAHSRMLRSSDTALDAVRGYLTGQARRFEGATSDVGTEVVVGTAADAVLAESERELGTIVVMTTHGRGGASRLLFGSTAQDVLEKARVPVLLIRVT